jgi:hypothetical protein
MKNKDSYAATGVAFLITFELIKSDPVDEFRMFFSIKPCFDLQSRMASRMRNSTGWLFDPQ